MIAGVALPIAVALFAWWFSTGAILWLVRRPRATHRTMLAVGALAALAATAVIVVTSTRTDASGAYLAFLSALVIWGWHEASFLMGVVTGPRPAACPAGAAGWARFKYAAMTLIHHEIALVATAAGLAAITWGQPNQAATWTFLLLLAMRLSAKFNIFLGVPHLTSEFFPDHLAHLKSYLRERPMNALYPFSLAGGSLLSVWLFAEAGAAAPGSGAATSLLLLGALTTLAMLEHLFMIIPWSDAALWRWAAPAQIRRADRAADFTTDADKARRAVDRLTRRDDNGL